MRKVLRDEDAEECGENSGQNPKRFCLLKLRRQNHKDSALLILLYLFILLLQRAVGYFVQVFHLGLTFNATLMHGILQLG